MPRRPCYDTADWHKVRAALDALAPDYPVIGSEALVEWFTRHGFKCNWNALLRWRKRYGEPFSFHLPAIGRHPGRPVSTHHLLLCWCSSQASKLGPPWSDAWVPGRRTILDREARARDRSRKGPGE